MFRNLIQGRKEDNPIRVQFHIKMAPCTPLTLLLWARCLFTEKYGLNYAQMHFFGFCSFFVDLFVWTFAIIKLNTPDKILLQFKNCQNQSRLQNVTLLRVNKMAVSKLDSRCLLPIRSLTTNDSRSSSQGKRAIGKHRDFQMEIQFVPSCIVNEIFVAAYGTSFGIFVTYGAANFLPGPNTPNFHFSKSVFSSCRAKGPRYQWWFFVNETQTCRVRQGVLLLGRCML